MGLFLLSAGTIAAVMFVMAVGLLFRRPCLRGSCGGPDVRDAGGRSLRCDACPRREAARGADPDRPVRAAASASARWRSGGRSA